MMQYRQIFFAQGWEAEVFLEFLDQANGENRLIRKILNDIGDDADGEISNEPSAGTSDTVYTTRTHVLTYNRNVGYVGLEEKVFEPAAA